MKILNKSKNLEDILYDIRGPIMEEAEAMEERGERVMKLNIGNPMPFGFRIAPSLRRAVRRNLRHAEGYAYSKGILSARHALYEYYRAKGVEVSSVGDIYIGNGVSELIHMTMQALINRGDEVLIPSPDYPLWSAAVRIAGGVVRYYRCDEKSSWYPDIKSVAAAITAKTRILIVINPNNPTGSVYPLSILQELVALAEAHNVVLCSDEIYSHMLYGDASFHYLSTLTSRTLCLTYSGLSKNHLACGFRSGWMIITGKKEIEGDFQDGFDMLANTRLCSNVPTQYAIAPALDRCSEGNSLTKDDGRLSAQREKMLEIINACPGMDCVPPQAAFYLFPKLDVRKFAIKSDTQFVLDLLRATNILVVQGSGFNYPDNAHFRMTFLPSVAELQTIGLRMQTFLEDYRQK